MPGKAASCHRNDGQQLDPGDGRHHPRDIRFFASDRADTMVEVRPVDPSRELDVKAAEQANIDGTTVASP